MKQVIRVTGEYVLIKQHLPSGWKHNEKGDVVNDLGIIMSPETYKGGSIENYSGEVLAVGDQVTRFKKGDFVFFQKDMFMPAYICGSLYLIMEERELPLKKSEVETNYEPDENEHIVNEEEHGWTKE